MDMARRIFAVFLRQFYLYRHSIHRWLALFYWATIEIFVWGFLTLYLNKIGAATFNFVPVLLGALIFWDLFNRAQQSISVSFLEDVWSRNLGNIFATPLRPLELVAGLMVVSVVQVAGAVVAMAGLSFLLWKLDIFSFGWLLLPFFLNLFMLGWALGVVVMALVLRLGPSVDIFAWSLAMLIQPLSAVFYPVSVLPAFLQKIAFLLPTSHVFEGMRAVIFGQEFLWERLLWAFGLNAIYFAAAVFFFLVMFKSVRTKGLLQRHTD
ncbi:MAG: hypothetical protein A2806_00395 [Candidatus Terrybacteria bacterium RIFCSPHIGHO2_01_FULL_48_17]|uniref:Transport permease protein n=1 Tax=Candidatus Terrybacteria bacterium RIFCSPHIGHO2_01_FULL_48_17 TaxID=1802362 RepID=A0A1G2PJT9_9BACT|nr:MAG: hypothetical protein A2806_00395 [Candidatus Terrybacteria bacterium RIFCSPHIGHO2_01_FULL_48_17]